MGNVWSPVHWPNTTTNPSVKQVAHAIAIDERRAFFRQNRWNPTAGQICSEVWFAGVHSDVGGGYPVSDGRLWAITLEWMAKRARGAGLNLDGQRLAAALGTRCTTCQQDYLSAQHDSLTWAWRPLEAIPRLRKQQNARGVWKSHLMIPALHAGFRGRPRTLKRGERVHRSAIERFVANESYRPPTLTAAGLDADKAGKFLLTHEDEWVVP
jgi:hypothetical protein